MGKNLRRGVRSEIEKVAKKAGRIGAMVAELSGYAADYVAPGNKIPIFIDVELFDNHGQCGMDERLVAYVPTGKNYRKETSSAIKEALTEYREIFKSHGIKTRKGVGASRRSYEGIHIGGEKPYETR